MLMRPDKAETAVHGCHCPGDMAVRSLQNKVHRNSARKMMGAVQLQASRAQMAIKDVRAQKFPRTDFFLNFGRRLKIIKLD